MCARFVCALCIAVVLTSALSAVAADIDPSLIGWWKFDEGSGGIAHDSGASGFEATLLGGPTWGTAPRHRGILVLDGTDDHVHIDGAPFKLPLYTVALWFRFDGGSGAMDIVSAKGPSGVNGIALEIQTAGTMRYLHRFPFASGGGSNIYTTQTYTDGAWHHVAAVKSASDMVLYMDGQQVGTQPDASQFDGPLGEIWLGTLDQRLQRMLRGALDDVRIYNRALSEQEILAIMQGQADPLAYSPQPPNGSLHEQVWATLSWGAGDYAASHNLYFGTSFDDVNEGAASVFVGNIASTSQIVGFPGFPAPEGLQFGAAYYWRVDEVNDLHPDSPWKGDIWSFTIPARKAYDPEPADGALFIDPGATLSWMPAFGAKLHYVYFGDSFDDVNNATGGAMQTTPTYDPASLELGKTYYWRVDEFDGTTTIKGDVWSFTATSPGGGLKGEYFSNINLIGEPALTRTDPGIDFTWGNASPEPNVLPPDTFSVRWRGEMEIAFSEPYRFYAVTEDGVKLWINDQLAVNRWDVFRLNEYRSTPIELQAGQHCTVEMWSYNNDAGATAQLLWESARQPKGIIPAAAFSLPVRAGSPKPGNGAVDVSQTSILTWVPGEYAAGHDVYFDKDAGAVADADTSTAAVYQGRRSSTDFSPGVLDWNTTYYWRVDEVNAVNPDSPWKGTVWSFTTADFLIVDDIESYNDLPETDPASNRIYLSWIDGYGTTTNGALVGYLDIPLTERTIVHGGDQAMPLAYDNNLKFSEATMTLTSGHDWTREGVVELALWFRGNAANAPERMYMALNGTAVVYNDDTSLTQKTAWTEWVIPLQQFAAQGVNLTNVTSITIGFGTRGNTTTVGGTGQMYFDDIRLYRPKTTP